MLSLTSLLVLASTAVVGIAQNIPIGFANPPTVVVAGQPFNITWSGGDGTGVTLTLRSGDPLNLNTVGILASNILTDYYVWTPDTSLPTASDYALQIQQGVAEINYSGLFSLVGGSGSSSLSYSGYTTMTGTSNMSMTVAPSTTPAGTAASMGTGTNLPRNTTFSSQSLTPMLTTSSATVTQTTTAPSNAASTMGSSAALAIGIVGAIMFLQ